MNERWLPIPGWAGLYSISDIGNVRSEARVVERSDGKQQTVRERLLRMVPDRNGYLRVNLFRNNVGFTRYVHQLVLSAFAGQQPEGLLSRHRNGDQVDNRLENLCYGTDSENKLDSVRHGTHANARKTECPSGHQYDDVNTYVAANGAGHCRACRADRLAAS